MSGGAEGAARALLVFERRGRLLALLASDVAEIAPDREADPVPLAPPEVAGLAVDRGRVLTVVDLDRALRLEPAPAAASYLVRLAPPHAHLALRVRAELSFEREDERELRPEVLDVARLLERLEARLSPLHTG